MEVSQAILTKRCLPSLNQDTADLGVVLKQFDTTLYYRICNEQACL